MIKNTTMIKNYSANDLLDKIIESRRAMGGTHKEMAYPFASGVLISIIEAARLSKDKNYLQKEINSNYHFYCKELSWSKEKLAA